MQVIILLWIVGIDAATLLITCVIVYPLFRTAFVFEREKGLISINIVK